ncbi:MAG: stage II sporulation protein M [Bowdeniella nasicola]|nr:stage II sporulation protein M [Bowdeniella nasicola]
MDTEAYSAARSSQWQRLQQLVAKRRLSGAETDELARLYHATSRDLSLIRTTGPEPAMITRLSTLIARARTRLTATEVFPLRSVLDFFTITIPVAFYRVRWWTLAVMAAFVIVALAAGIAFVQSPELRATVGTPAQLREYAEAAFTAYYTNFPAPDFAAQVWTNNAWIAAVCIGGGITGFLPITVLYTNAVGVGQAGAIMWMHNYIDVFFAYILPHGMLELTAIFVAGGTGLRLCWALIDPGRRSRLQSVGEAGRTLAVVAVGLVGVLFIAGLIEGFVTGSTLPLWVKLTIGTIAVGGYWLYTLILGGMAYRRGLGMDHGDDASGYQQIEILTAAQQQAALTNGHIDSVMYD